VHHLRARSSQQGEDTEENLITLCARCQRVRPSQEVAMMVRWLLALKESFCETNPNNNSVGIDGKCHFFIVLWLGGSHGPTAMFTPFRSHYGNEDSAVPRVYAILLKD